MSNIVIGRGIDDRPSIKIDGTEIAHEISPNVTLRWDDFDGFGQWTLSVEFFADAIDVDVKGFLESFVVPTEDAA